ncbi:hypothetical protein Tco_0702712 [Tanacetum coccineum]|uniref:Reverse transcriptase domain-containing protein n=1 Tax=Tanacetum coccineum TaxID=301880 RepID=A0ABQ4XYE1_9ASTR
MQKKAFEILEACHRGPTVGTLRSQLIQPKKVFDAMVFIGLPFNKVLVSMPNIDLKTAGDHSKASTKLNLASIVIKLTENSPNLQGETKKLHDSKDKVTESSMLELIKSCFSTVQIKDFLRKASSPDGRTFHNPKVYPLCTANCHHADGSNFKVNCHRLKHYYGGDTPPLVIPDLQTFPKDN